MIEHFGGCAEGGRILSKEHVGGGVVSLEQQSGCKLGRVAFSYFDLETCLGLELFNERSDQLEAAARINDEGVVPGSATGRPSQ